MKLNKKYVAAFTLVIATVMVAAACNPSFAFGKSENRPALAAFAKSEQIGALVTFSEADFTSRVSGSEKLEAIVLSALPEKGVLRLAGRTLLQGEAVSVTALNTLCFVPDDGETDIYTCFSFLPVFSKSGAAANAVTVAINVSESKNSPPIAMDLTYETYVGVKLVAPFQYTDIDGDAVTFTIANQPKKGTVEATDDGFSYTPYDGKSGADSFTYTATDARGNTSKTATVTIEIVKRPSKETFTYTDLDNSAAHYAALRLRDEGILIGETIGAENFLYPEKTVSRAEFVTLVASVTEMALPTVAVGTGLSDNSAIPTWAQPYVAAAIHVGVIQGERNDEGNRVFRADDGITRAEAAGIINRALQLANDGRGLQFADSANIPDWSAQSVINTTAAEILPVFADGTVRANTQVTREDAVQMLYQMLCYQESDAAGGFFSWFR